MWQTWCHERLQHQAMTRAQGTRKINDPRFIRDAPNDTPQLRIVFDWVYNTKPWPGWRSPTSLFAGEKFLSLCERLRDLFHKQIRKVLFYDFVLPRKFRNQTSDLWTDAATALTRTREEKESEEREREKERVSRNKIKSEAARAEPSGGTKKESHATRSRLGRQKVAEKVHLTAARSACGS